MNSKSLPLILVSFLLVGCLGQSQPLSTLSPTPVNNPPIADFTYSWTGGDKDQPWTCSKITFEAEVSDPDGDSLTLYWHDNGKRIPNALGEPEFSTKLYPDGIHTIKLMVMDSRGAQTFVEKQINVKYEVPEPVPVKNKNGLNIASIYVSSGVEPETHPDLSWSMSQYTPLLGSYDLTNPVTVDWHIKWALEHGINTLWIVVAPHGNPPTEAGKGSYMIYFKDGFLNAKYKNRIKFNVIFDTRLYNPYDEGMDKEYGSNESVEKDIKILSKYYFNDPNYRKINGKPILFLYATHMYLCGNCKKKKEREELLKSHVKSMRETAKKNGYELFLVGDVREYEKNDEFLISIFDALTSYNLRNALDEEKYKSTTDEKGFPVLIAPYDNMVTFAIEREKRLSRLTKEKGKIYISSLTQGWSDEKRYNAKAIDFLTTITNPTPEKYLEFLKGVESLIEPKTNMLVTTWNEFMEGNAIEPTREFGFAYLDIIRDNFAIKPAGGWPPNIVPTKNCGCAEYKNWNVEIGMPPPLILVLIGAENEIISLALLKGRKVNYSSI